MKYCSECAGVVTSGLTDEDQREPCVGAEGHIADGRPDGQTYAPLPIRALGIECNRK